MAPQVSKTPQELVYREGFKASDNDYDADKVTRCQLQNMRFSEIENCMQRTKYYILHYQFDDIVRTYVNSITDFVRIANFKYGVTIEPEKIYYDPKGNLRTDWMLTAVSKVFKNQ